MLYCQVKVEETKRKGLRFFQSGKVDEAIIQFNRYISVKQGGGEGYNLRGLCYEQKKQYQKAAEDFKTAYYLSPSETDFKKNLDRVKQLWNNELYRVIERNKQVISSGAGLSNNYLEIGRSYKQLELWEFAEKWYDEYLIRDEKASPEVVIEYSEALAKTGSIIKGEKALKQFIEIYPQDWGIWSRFGYFNYWLGKNKPAEDAFTKALSLKPNFREAEEGLNLTRSKDYGSVFQPRSFERSYKIDKYYETLKENPGNDNTRFLLVEELLKAERFDEAGQQIQYLQPNYENDANFKRLNSLLNTTKEASYSGKTDEFKAYMNENPDDREALKKFASYCFNLSRFSEAEELLSGYVSRVPSDNELRYIFAQTLTSERKLDDAYSEILKVIENDSLNLNYKLLAGQLGVWLSKDSASSEAFLEKVLASEPGNINALTSMGIYHFQKSDLENAQVYADKAKLINPEDPNLIQLISMIETQKYRNEKERLLKRLEEAQFLIKEEKYSEAKPYFEEAIAFGQVPDEVLEQYAGIQMKLNNYPAAITLYDTLVAKTGNSAYDKLRAKAYLISGDSIRAASEFERLVQDNPNDVELKVYLADSYVKLGKYDEARKLYKETLASAPVEFAVEDKLSDLPPEPGTFRSFMHSFTTDIFSYLDITPGAYYYSDNLEFDYFKGGIAGETSLNHSISIGGSYSKGLFSNSSKSVNFTEYKGSITIKTSGRTSFGFSYGIMSLEGIEDQPVINAFIKFEDKEQLQASLKYAMADGAALLCSPDLVTNRIRTHSFRLDALYNYEDKLKVFGYYQLFITEKSSIYYNKEYELVKGNVGNYFMIRFGKSFYNGFFAGYEYLYSDFKYTLEIYYTPEEFNSHSLWGEWEIAKDYEWELYLGGKIGYIPQADYVVREANFKIIYKLTNNFRLGINGFINNTERNNSAFKSSIINANIYWSL